MQVTSLATSALLGSVAVAAVASDDTSPNPATLFTRDNSGGDATSCGVGYMPTGAVCCPGSNVYCQKGYTCAKDNSCCPNGETCTSIASCEAGQKLCHNACVPEGADCCSSNSFCPPDYYCGSGDKCVSNGAAGGSGNTVSRGVVVAVAGAVGYFVSRR